MRVEKYGCGSEFRRTPGGRYQMTILPAILLEGQFTRLWDAGYQKFLITDDRRKLPALAAQLRNLRQIQRRAALRARRAHLLQRGPGLDLSGHDLRPGSRTPRRRSGRERRRQEPEIAVHRGLGHAQLSRHRALILRRGCATLRRASSNCLRNCSRSTRCLATFRAPSRITGTS